jgi:hypothetical protein
MVLTIPRPHPIPGFQSNFQSTRRTDGYDMKLKPLSLSSVLAGIAIGSACVIWLIANRKPKVVYEYLSAREFTTGYHAVGTHGVDDPPDPRDGSF